MPKQVTNSGRKCIVIVEDSADFSNLLKFLVEDEGFEGVQFPLEQDDIVSLAKNRKPAAILMDLALRRKSGLEFIEDLKADPATKNIPILVITGRDLTHREVLGLEFRGVKYLRKGRVEINEIKQAIIDAARPKKPSAAAEKKE
jgi:DNA-binding response OmpR family regulator